MCYAQRCLRSALFAIGLTFGIDCRGAELPSEITPKTVIASMKKVADWQLANPSRRAATEWTQGACYAGMMALASLSDDPKYHDAMMEMARQNAWKPRDPASTNRPPDTAAQTNESREVRIVNRIYHADDQCVLQTYLELFLQHRDPEMLAGTQQRCNHIMTNPLENEDDLMFTKDGATRKWSWCDALFMAPPVWARLTAATGDRKYLNYMNRHWWVTSGYLYDQDEHLYYRDSRFFTEREANGKKVFWCRGNGWVMAGLALVLQFMPADYPDRPKYVTQLKEMSVKLVTLQSKDGLWRPSLLDSETYPTPDSSGSGFILYGLTYGVNQKLLDRATYEPSIRKGWQGLQQCVDATGRLGFVQPTGDRPVQFASTNTDVYGVGAFLLAGSEIYRLANNDKP